MRLGVYALQSSHDFVAYNVSEAHAMGMSKLRIKTHRLPNDPPNFRKPIFGSPFCPSISSATGLKNLPLPACAPPHLKRPLFLQYSDKPV
jgi:hypothetical protein